MRQSGVTITRYSLEDDLISYKLRDHRACRGDTLGSAYTALSVYNDWAYNTVAEIYSTSSAGIGKAERAIYYEWGKVGSVPRTKIDRLCDIADRVTWTQKQRLWDDYRQARDKLWTGYQERQAVLQAAVDDAYRRRQLVRTAEWMLNPWNRRVTLAGIIIAVILLSRNQRYWIDAEIAALKEQQDALRDWARELKLRTRDTVTLLKQRDLPLDTYMASLKRLHDLTDDLFQQGAKRHEDSLVQQILSLDVAAHRTDMDIQRLTHDRADIAHLLQLAAVGDFVLSDSLAERKKRLMEYYGTLDDATIAQLDERIGMAQDRLRRLNSKIQSLQAEMDLSLISPYPDAEGLPDKTLDDPGLGGGTH